MRGGVRTCAHGAWGRAARAAGYDALAKAEKLKPMELELRRLEDLSSSIVHNFAEMKKREAEHRDTNESTNERMLHFSIFSASTPLPLLLPLRSGSSRAADGAAAGAGGVAGHVPQTQFQEAEDHRLRRIKSGRAQRLSR